MKLSDLGETGLLDLFRDWTGGASGRVHLGVGDDGAILDPTGNEQVVISTDAWVEGVHFSREYLKPDEIGHRAMAGSLSDLAAMGARGIAAFVNLHAPPSESVVFVRGLYQGLDRVADSCGAVIAGGDTVRGEVALDLTVVGLVGLGKAIRRKGAQPGDILCVSGSLGAAEAGRRSLAGELEEPLPKALREEAETAHRLPRPRFDVSGLLTTLERRTVDVELERETVEPVRPTAMMDVSDGLSADLIRLCEASHVGCVLDEARIPVSPAARRVGRLAGGHESDLALGGGEDFELLFTWPAADAELLLETAQKRGIAISPIGSITPIRDGRVLRRADGKAEPMEAAGWDHFAGKTPRRPARGSR